MTVVGLDFGTTNSVVSFVQGESAIACLDYDSLPVPSVVGYRGGRVITGRDAKREIARAGLGVQGGFVRSPKRYLGRERIVVDGVERSPIDVASASLGRVLQVARRFADAPSCSRAVVTIPIVMAGIQRRALREALQRAGVETVQFVHEPFAALYRFLRDSTGGELLRRFDGRSMLVCDWGGGTLDLTLCQLRDRTLTQLANSGSDEVGGDYFDEAIKARVLEAAREIRSPSEDHLAQPGAEAKLLLRCEEAKMSLSQREQAVVYIPSYWRGDGGEVDCTLTRAEFEASVGSLVEKGLDCLDSLLESEGHGRDEVGLCLVTGGMANMPLIRSRLHERFGPVRVRTPDSAGTFISEGAAWVAADRAEVELAKNLEVVLAAEGASRRSFFPLIKAGTMMPRVGEEQRRSFHFFCTDPRDGCATFELCVPKASGPSPLSAVSRRSLECLTVDVDARARPFDERLELDVVVDHDLVVRVHARSVMTRDEASLELHDLEFAVRLPERLVRPGVSEGADSPEVTTDPLDEQGDEGERTFGAVRLRPNLAKRKQDSLIPGELLYSYRPEYFDVRCNPPERQILELDYYRSCAACGRASNDPLCRCDAPGQGPAGFGRSDLP